MNVYSKEQKSVVIVGRFGKTHGIKGWIRVHSFTIPQENLLNYTPWLVKHNQEWKILAVEAKKTQGKDILVKLVGFDTPESVHVYTNVDIGIDRIQLPRLAADQYYWDDLIGLEVVNSKGIILGIVDSLHETGANDVLVVVGENRRHLIPYISNVINKIDIKNKTISVDWDEDF